VAHYLLAGGLIRLPRPFPQFWLNQVSQQGHYPWKGLPLNFGWPKRQGAFPFLPFLKGLSFQLRRN